MVSTVFLAHKKALLMLPARWVESENPADTNGNYHGEGRVYFDGHHQGTRFDIRVNITVEDHSITFDYSETDSQTDGFVNGTFTSSASATILTFLQMINPDIPHNEGMVRRSKSSSQRAPSSTPVTPRRPLSVTTCVRPMPTLSSGHWHR
jgi:N-methylhydantoinase B/oxoprolinase/acetone carboxylase alpha subunit